MTRKTGIMYMSSYAARSGRENDGPPRSSAPTECEGNGPPRSSAHMKCEDGGPPRSSALTKREGNGRQCCARSKALLGFG